MRITVIGASGLIGTKVSQLLTADGHEVVPASRESGVDVLTGEGLADALAGADALVDVVNSPSFDDEPVMHFFTTSTSNLVKAAKAAGVRHYVALSIVGLDGLPESGYLRAKVAQEKLITESGLPYTIVRATQFQEFADAIVASLTYGSTVRVPDALIQPIAATTSPLRWPARPSANRSIAPPTSEGRRRCRSRRSLAGSWHGIATTKPSSSIRRRSTSERGWLGTAW